MSLIEYFKEKFNFLLINILIVLTISMFMFLSSFSIQSIILFVFIWFAPLLSYMIIDGINKKIYYAKVKVVLDNLKDKYLIPEIMEKPNFIEGCVLYEILQETNKSMNENVKKYKIMQREYREYIETWVHEIKTPIASVKLILENNERDIKEKINPQLDKIENFIEKVLYYAKIADANKDYIVKNINLKEITRKVIRRNSKDFINKKVKPDIEQLDEEVFSDSKWVEFILNQIISNSLKYSKEKDSVIKIYSAKNKSNIVLTIEDNGIGINEKDIVKVFDKGFTGENGREFGKSTGIGLYLCKKLCEKLGLGINIESKKGNGTKINIIFPLSEFNLNY